MFVFFFKYVFEVALERERKVVVSVRFVKRERQKRSHH